MITINIDKARAVAHQVRRGVRDKHFAPHDTIIARQIPGQDAAEAETMRQLIREQDATYQTRIDAAEDLETLKAVMDEMTADTPE